MYTVFNREPFTKWKIVIVDRSLDKTMEEVEAEDSNYFVYEEFFCTYRTTYRDGRECEQFSIVSDEIDYVVLQMQIFKNGDIKYFNTIPASIDINKHSKRIEILLLDYCKENTETKGIYFEYTDLVTDS
ncbi:hypothetical protein [uncultured Clostridium sp.]|uniref:hypothetical protein n=1 Tax=uncultured Clostridium sp. TaxID=59620 RepID=UPI0028E9A3C0|nr:hypothetical protein [uncultured Clostridium sp.]